MSNEPPNQPQNQRQQQPQQQQQPPQQQPQQRRRQQRQQPPGGPRQPQYGGGGGGGLGQNVVMVAAALAVVGLAFGLAPTVLGTLGDDAVLYGTEEEIEQQQNPYENVPDEQAQEARERENAQQKQSLVRTVDGFGPYFAFLLAGISGAVVAGRLSGSTRDVVITAGAGALLGAALFVFLSTFLASFQWASYQEGQQATEASVQFGSLLINSIGIGILGAIGSAGSAYFTDQIGE